MATELLDRETLALAPSSALHTDRYELTMATAARQSGVARNMATFEVFARSLPGNRRFGVFAGLGRLIDLVENFRFDPADIEWLLTDGAIDASTAEWLADYKFDGTIDGYREGDLWFPFSPVCTITAPFAVGTMLETLVLSVLNHDSAIATAAARMRLAAGSRKMIEMGSRRTHEEAAIAAARAAYIGGIDATSNLAAARLYGIPSAGTAAHAFTLAHLALGNIDACSDVREHDAELAAFVSQLRTLGSDTTLLIDTFDIPTGISNAIEAAHICGLDGPGAIRIDSGVLADVVPAARKMLDAAGATKTRIVVSGDLDESGLAALAHLPADVYGVGTKLVTGSGSPTCGFVMKLTAIATGPECDDATIGVAKRSTAKASRPGRHLAWRLLDTGGFATGECVVTRHVAPMPLSNGALAPDTHESRALQVRYMAAGQRLIANDLRAARAHCRAALSELRPMHKSLEPGVPAFTAAN